MSIYFGSTTDEELISELRHRGYVVKDKNINNESDAISLLRDLATALDNAFISTWQTTSGWQKQLDAALQFLEKGQSNDCDITDEELRSKVESLGATILKHGKYFCVHGLNKEQLRAFYSLAQADRKVR